MKEMREEQECDLLGCVLCHHVAEVFLLNLTLLLPQLLLVAMATQRHGYEYN